MIERARALVRQRSTTAILVFFALLSAATGAFSLFQLRSAARDARQLSDDLVSGLDLIAGLQFDVQEARRRMLYALTTTDANLQVQYVDESRAADARIQQRIAEHLRRLSMPGDRDRRAPVRARLGCSISACATRSSPRSSRGRPPPPSSGTCTSPRRRSIARAPTCSRCRTATRRDAALRRDDDRVRVQPVVRDGRRRAAAHPAPRDVRPAHGAARASSSRASAARRHACSR